MSLSRRQRRVVRKTEKLMAKRAEDKKGLKWSVEVLELDGKSRKMPLQFVPTSSVRVLKERLSGQVHVETLVVDYNKLREVVNV